MVMFSLSPCANQQDPFPISVVFGKVWNNAKGQLSILRFAAAAPAEVFSFDRVARKQVSLLHCSKRTLRATISWLQPMSRK